MQIVPEINIMSGHCVCHVRSDSGYYEMVSHSPRKVAKVWEFQGAPRIHICDLDGVVVGNVINQESIKKLVDYVAIPVDVYGGITSMKSIETTLDLGIDRVILSLNSKNMTFVKEAVKCFGTERIEVKVERKLEHLNRTGSDQFGFGETRDIVKQVVSCGISGLLYDGTAMDSYSESAELKVLSQLTKNAGVKLIINGGVRSIKELENIKNAGVDEVILGDVLYEHRIELRNAIELFDKGVNKDE